MAKTLKMKEQPKKMRQQPKLKGATTIQSAGNKARSSEKKASAALRAKAKGRSTTNKSTTSKIVSGVKSVIKEIEKPFPAQVKGGTYVYQEPKKKKK